MSHAVALLPDGEVGQAARRVVDAAGSAVEWRDPAAKALDLRVSVDHCRALEGARTRFPETDLVVVREIGPGADFVDVEAALGRAHALERTVTLIGAPPPDGDDRVESEPAEGLCGRLVSHPEDYDVLVLPALLGAVVSDLAAGMAGGPGLTPYVAYGTDGTVFGAPPATGNPAGLMLAGALLLRHLGEGDAAERLEHAVTSVIRRGETVTADLKPTRNDPSAVGVSQFADAVIEEMENP